MASIFIKMAAILNFFRILRHVFWKAQVIFYKLGLIKSQ